MSEQWYWRTAAEKHGPVSESELRQLATRGELDDSCLVRLGDSGQWVPAAKIKGLLPANKSAQGKAKPRSEADSKVRSRPPLKRAKPLTAKPQPPSPAPAKDEPKSPASFEQEALSDSASFRRRRKTAIVPLAIAAGIGIAVIGIVVASARLYDVDSTETAGRSSTAPENEADIETDPATVADEVPTSSSAPRATSAPPQVSPYRAVKKWHDASLLSLGRGHARVKVSAAWVQSNEEEDESTGLVCLELEVTNTSRDRRFRYSSWNGTGRAGTRAQAQLFAGEGTPLPMVPVDETTIDGRVETVELIPGETVRDVIVFRAPSEEYEDLKLVLPRAAIGLTGTPIGYSVPRAMVDSGIRPHPPTGAPAPPAEDAASQAISDAVGIMEESPEAMKADNGDQPASINDLKNSIKRESLKEKLDKKRKKAAEK